MASLRVSRNNHGELMRYKKIGFILFFILGILQANIAIAGCGFYAGSSYQTKYFNFGNVIVQRDSSIGTVVASNNTGAWLGGNSLFGCTTPWTVRWELSRFTTLSSINGVYNTNIPGIGLRLSSSANGTVFPYDLAAGANIYASISGGILAELVKTSPGSVGGGSITGGVVAKTSIVGVMYGGEVDMGTNTIIPVACSIMTPNLTFPIGNILASTFGSSIGTTPSGAQNTQSLGLNCDAQANINVSLSGTQNPDVGTTSVLALIGQGNPGVAKGVGVQIVYNGTPLSLNSRVVLKRSAGGQETLPLVARYYQTKTAVATGTANASATLNLTYQ